MSGNLQLEYPHPEHRPGYEWGRHALDTGINAAKARAFDLLLARGAAGGFLDAVAAAATSPASLSVEVAALEGYDKLGNHLRRAVPTTVNCAVAYDGTSTVPTSGNRWITIFLLFKWLESNPQEYEGTIYYEDLTEDVEFRIYKGTTTTQADRTKVPPPANPGGGAVRVCDIWLTEGIAAILAGNIDYSAAHQDRIGSALLKSGGTMAGIIVSPQGIPLGQTARGSALWSDGTHAVPVAGDDQAVWFPTWMEGMFCSNFVINHGIRSAHVCVDVAINFADPPKTYSELYMQIHTYLLKSGEAAQIVSMNIHDGAAPSPNYLGQTLVSIIGTESAVSAFRGRWTRWLAYAPMF